METKQSTTEQPNADKTISKKGKSQAKNLTMLISKIRTDVQNYASALTGITRDSDRLAPMVANAFAEFQTAFPKGTKLEFIKYFATEEQAKAWPETDMQAKMPGSSVQSLFNSIEYLLRRAVQLKRIAEHEAEVARVRAEAEKDAIAKGKAQGLKGHELELFVNHAKEEATRHMLSPAASGRTSQEDIVAIIEEGWETDLDTYENFCKFVARLLSAKYSEKTVQTILAKVTEDLTPNTEETTEPASQPAAEHTVVTQIRGRRRSTASSSSAAA